MDQLTIERQAPVIAQYDAVVCGGGPAGWVAAVSACGPDAAGLSKIADPFGTVTAQAGTGEELLIADIDADRVDEARRALPVLVNRRFAEPEMI